MDEPETRTTAAEANGTVPSWSQPDPSGVSDREGVTVGAAHKGPLGIFVTLDKASNRGRVLQRWLVFNHSSSFLEVLAYTLADLYSLCTLNLAATVFPERAGVEQLLRDFPMEGKEATTLRAHPHLFLQLHVV
ncbi:hypothetical protein AK812_SmicGene44329 [Symbiodinium microadriaticum]|uniref:Uncharacterized protein n=1 Tax=Symbiodinium microadriaticum TaxID=2951 RepID=A0A1Q9BYS1_SYMMI|nr:hypothetical protein AK812_SmicGene44329 [Symbiodinium microadriaticum]